MIVDAPTMQVALPPGRFEFRPAETLSEEDFFQLCQRNRDLRLERTSTGTIIVMPPAGGATGHRNAKITAQLDRWADADGTGVAFDSSTGFTLPDGSTRSPDAAWVQRERLAELSPEQKERFLPLCPDFAIELRSPSDTLPDLLDKMEKYVANGLQLGWLIDPIEQRVHIVRPNRSPTLLDASSSLSGDPILSGFTLDLEPIWNPDL